MPSCWGSLSEMLEVTWVSIHLLCATVLSEDNYWVVDHFAPCAIWYKCDYEVKMINEHDALLSACCSLLLDDCSICRVIFRRINYVLYFFIFSKQVVLALEYLHKHGIIHRYTAYNAHYVTCIIICSNECSPETGSGNNDPKVLEIDSDPYQYSLFLDVIINRMIKECSKLVSEPLPISVIMLQCS